MDGDKGISWHCLPGATLDDCLKRTRAIIGWNKQSGITIILDALQNSMSRSSTKEIRLKLLEIESLNSRQVKVIVAECCFPPDLLRKNLKSKIEHCNNMVRIMNIKLGLKSSLKLWKLGSRFKNDIFVTSPAGWRDARRTS